MSVKVTDKDIVLLGHGSYEGGTVNFKLPDNINLYVLQPVGYSLMTDAASALIQQTEIKTLVLHGGGKVSTVPANIVVFNGGQNAPNLKLYNLGDLADWGKKTIGAKQNVVTVAQTISLLDLINSDIKIKAALKALSNGQKLNIYWSACANQVSGYYASLT